MEDPGRGVAAIGTTPSHAQKRGNAAPGGLAYLQFALVLFLQRLQQLLVQALGSPYQSLIPFDALHLQPQPQGHEAGEVALASVQGGYRQRCSVLLPTVTFSIGGLHTWAPGPHKASILPFTSPTPGHLHPWAWA